MASADMCDHDWPGSGCKECRAEIEKRESALRTCSSLIELRTLFADNTIGLETIWHELERLREYEWKYNDLSN